MTDIGIFLNAVKDDLKSKFPKLKSCEVHCGRFTIDELGAQSLKCPLFRIALFDVATVPDSSGATDIPMSLSVVIVTADDAKGKIDRFDAANNLVNALAVHVTEREFTENSFPAEDVRGRNLYSGKIRTKRIQLWEVTWKQTIRVAGSRWTDDETMLDELYIGQAPRIGADHKDDYVQVISSEDLDANS